MLYLTTIQIPTISLHCNQRNLLALKGRKACANSVKICTANCLDHFLEGTGAKYQFHLSTV